MVWLPLVGVGLAMVWLPLVGVGMTSGAPDQGMTTSDEWVLGWYMVLLMRV